MKKFIVVSVAINLLLFLMVACGGNGTIPGSGGGGGPVPHAIAQAKASFLRGSHIFAAKKTTAVNWSLTTPLYAQVSTTVSLSQSFEGACLSSPASPGGTAGFLMYGLGQRSDASCSQTWYSDPAPNAPEGEIVVGNGTISNLVVYTAQGTVISSNAVAVKVYAHRGGNTIDTGVSCTLPAGHDYLKCDSTQTFAAQDGDLMVATASYANGDNLVGLKVLFTKQ